MLSVTSFQSAGSVDLLADGESESSESVWDNDGQPLTQVSLKRSLEDSRQEYRDSAWAPPPTAADAPISQARSLGYANAFSKHAATRVSARG